VVRTIGGKYDGLMKRPGRFCDDISGRVLR
jgi:hypothetical protein